MTPWDDRPTRPRLARRFELRLSDEEAETLADLATAAGMPAAQVLRAALWALAEDRCPEARAALGMTA